MHTRWWKRAGAVLAAGVLALTGCEGPKGDAGAKGDQGDQGNQGDPGVSVGTLAGTVRSQAGDALAGVVVTTTPLALTATTGATGAYSIANVPSGVYSVAFDGNAASAASATVANVSVPAGVTTTLDQTLQFSPLKITTTPAPVATAGNFWKIMRPVGFGADVALGATVTGATGALTYAWTQTSGPTTATLTGANTASPSFTTATLSQMIAGGKLQFFRAAAGKGTIPITAGQTALMTYNFKVTASDGKYTQTATVAIPTTMWTAAGANGAVGIPVYAKDDAAVAADGWKLSFDDGSGAAAVDKTASLLKLANDKNPWFIPDAAGAWTLKNGAADASPIVVNVSTWKGAPSKACAGCHSNTTTPQGVSFLAKMKDWTNSAHGNQFWRLMEYDDTGALVWKTDDAGNPLPAPTAMADASGKTIYWTTGQKRMTVVEYGLSNAEGAHYGESCTQCHSVGQNPLVSNDGFDDQAGYAWPGALLHDTGDLTQPDPAAWNAIPAGSRDRAGIQCENCHGPLAQHAADGSMKPTAFFDAETCGVCHDRATNHDRFQLWAQGGHSNAELAQGEGTSTNCGRCHSAQGFVEWSKHGFDPAYTLAAGPALATVQPVTCQACHDPHTLAVRELPSVAITSGFTVSGMGAGQLCVVCHSSRRGLHNDSLANTSYSLPHAAAQTDLFLGQNVYFVDPAELASGATMSTHAIVLEGTCAGCHMEREVAFEGLTSNNVIRLPTNTNHSFRVNSNACGVCHGETKASFEAVKAGTEGRLAAVQAELVAAAKRMLPSAGYKLTGVAATINGTPFTGKAVFAVKPDVVTIGIAGSHGTGFTFHFNGTVDVTFLAADNAGIPGGVDATVTLGDATNGTDVGATVSATGITTLAGAAVIPANSDLFKAWWNMALIEDEGSFGGHNPRFTQQVLLVTLAKLQAIPTAP